MPPASRTLLWYLLEGTRGGPNRRRILELLERSPHNANQLAASLDIDYRTVRHHLHLLEQNGVVLRPVGTGYAAPYELSPEVAARWDELRRPRTGRESPGSRRAPIGAREGPGA